MEKIRIIIAEDKRIHAQGLRTMLEEDPLVEFCGIAANGREALALAEEVKPDMVIMDVQMPVMNGIEATRELLRRQPGVKVLALTMHSNEFLIVDMVEAGAMGYVDKLASEDYLPDAIRTLQKGLHYHCPTTSTRLSKLIAASRAKLNMVDLTYEEMEYIRLLCQERTTKEIADHFLVSESTIERTRKRIQEKVGAKTPEGIVLFAVRKGLV